MLFNRARAAIIRLSFSLFVSESDFSSSDNAVTNKIASTSEKTNPTPNGDRYACACIGWMYKYGNGVTLNHSRAVKWFRRAAEQGYACAQWYLGVMYGRQDSVNKDYVKAFDWYRKAAEQGHVDAQLSLEFPRQAGIDVVYEVFPPEE